MYDNQIRLTPARCPECGSEIIATFAVVQCGICQDPEDPPGIYTQDDGFDIDMIDDLKDEHGRVKVVCEQNHTFYTAVSYDE